MKKIYITFFVLFVANIVSAQLTLTKAFNGPVSGDVLIENYFDSTTAISRVTGTNKIWNYTSVVTSTSSSNNTTYTLASSLPSAASAAFPAASLASFNGPATSTTSYNMIKSNPTNEEILGTWDASNGPTTYSNTEIDLTYPFTYGSVWSDVSAYTSGTGTNTTNQSSTVTLTGVGTGTLILPGNITLTNCLQVKLHGVVATTGPFPISATVTAYEYYHASQKFPVALFSYVTFDFLSQISTDFSFSINNAVLPVGIKQNSINSAFSLFPNPVNDKINITTDINSPKQIEVSVNDVTGKLIRTETLNTEEKNYLNVSELEKGIYFLTINMNGAVSRKKFVKE